MSKSMANPCLTEKQALRLVELEAKGIVTGKQQEEMADLLVKRANSSKIVLSDTCIAYLMEVYAWETARKVSVSKDMDIEYIQKGRLVEPESIELLSFVENTVYTKNEQRVSNDFLTGCPDIYVGETIMTATKITDIKSIWDYPTFLCKIHKGLENGYTDQLRGYMDITGARESEVANCLITMPEVIINDYRRRLLYKMNVATDENPEYKAFMAELEQSMNFDDIPPHKRVYKLPVEPFSDFEQQAVYDRVKVCREWLCQFDEYYNNLNS